jgi:exodeoxyribonuclease VII small subunit
MSKKKAESQDVGKNEAPGFEQALERLEKIVREMESGELSLESMMARFEEGQKLVKSCGETLGQVERRIEILVKEGNKVVAKPFDTGRGVAEPEDEGDEGAGSGLPF